MTKKKKIGRPVLPQDSAKDVMLSARFTKAEALSIAKAATKAGQKKTEWIRNSLLKSAGHV
jgi:hypothetical protein